MEKKSRNPISVRLTKEVAEKFRTLAQQNDVSQSDFIEILLKRFEETQQNNHTSQQVLTDQPFQILLSKTNDLTNIQGKKYVKPMKLCFNGHYVYYIPPQNRILQRADRFEEELKREFDISISLENFLLYDSIDIAYDSDREKYLVIERVGLKKEDETRYDLFVNRCYYAKDLEEIKIKFHTYVSDEDKKGIEMALAETITDDEQLKLFQ
ncbi:ribbon-helix-helix protein, CopG family [Clostridium botulinum]|uniref:ribbon-helix-helix protein, CopG family n=1 Tax=Clostridium botulinum TaxID=1491 RepID=UPI000774004C|nr:ribbon-helix-helix protein, CopG family [Clostridium botulinum]NFE94355.1 ribbon-helix-helix protein, CopG family [Clostridium botulinum]NFL37831.1 ribbon-helix-helix protein, CopG family [Clostridium botulinum]NFL64121.1 ribbon-helix-helix protein, CopG family [Clostridium botulinum]NFN07747.1 ribbon-helix-helix protein, CopG family [Clostridium botulinum]NFN23982.1 ribbon-helix-helix protein, CopG family [Clostridium botulinum]